MATSALTTESFPNASAGPCVFRITKPNVVGVGITPVGHVNTAVLNSGSLAAPCGGGSITCAGGDRKSTRLNSSHLVISYAVFCLKKKKKDQRVVGAARLRASCSAV